MDSLIQKSRLVIPAYQMSITPPITRQRYNKKLKFYLIHQLQNVDISATVACQRLFGAFFISSRLVTNGYMLPVSSFFTQRGLMPRHQQTAVFTDVPQRCLSQRSYCVCRNPVAAIVVTPLRQLP